jgi:Cellulase (glycosyl hydrolase family 5)
MRLLSFLALTLLLSIPCFSQAEVQSRGFQIGLQTVTTDEIRELAEEWNVNLVRVQIGDNFNMDGVTGTGYITMMEGQFALFDTLVPTLNQYGIKVVFALYSPPGGFATREGPAHYQMFSTAGLQDDYIEMWRQIITRYGNNSAIAAFDLLNEPALRSSLLCAECRDWSDLLTDTLAAIREINQTATIMVKSIYGDPTKLSSLPLINDPNIIYSYHAYPYVKYQHAGIEGTPADVKRPSPKAVKNKLRSLLGRFFQKYHKAVKKGLVASYPPRLNAGEFAVSACSTKQPHIYLQNVIEVLEGGKATPITATVRNRTKRCRGNSDRCKVLRKKEKGLSLAAAKRQVVHESWTNHAFAEANVWDPRYECPNGEPEFVGGTTARAQVLKSFLARNQ